MCVGSLAGVTYLCYTVLRSSNKSETTVHCCDPALSVLVMFVSRSAFHVVSALQSFGFLHLQHAFSLCSLSFFVVIREENENYHVVSCLVDSSDWQFGFDCRLYCGRNHKTLNHVTQTDWELSVEALGIVLGFCGVSGTNDSQLHSWCSCLQLLGMYTCSKYFHKV